MNNKSSHTLNEVNRAIQKVDRSLANFLESQASIWDSYVDPREAYLGDEGEQWTSVASAGLSPLEELPFRTCTELFQLQSIGRRLWRDNEFAINGHKNRINYIVGKSHTYTIVGLDQSVPTETIAHVQRILDRILKINRWKNRQKEIKLRDDRDGESFIRKFRCADGIMRFRFVEPRSIQPPPSAGDHQSFGVQTEPHDIENVVAYYIDGNWVDASEIQHRKHNVDSAIKRGLPLFYPVRKNLGRAARLLRNMSTATEIQTAIALIRKHQQATRDAVRTFVNAQATGQELRPNGQTENILRYGPGSIIDVPMGQDYEIPPQLDPRKTVAALQAELRAVASRLVMPEFMLTSDASNANFASTMVAEGPAVKNFESEQDAMIEFDLELLEQALDFAVDNRLITAPQRAATKIDVQPPSVHIRDRLREAKIRQIDLRLGIVSHQTATAESGRDYIQEQSNISQHCHSHAN